MGWHDELESEVRKIFRDQWTTRDGTVVPESENLSLGNDAVSLEGTVLYADLSGSTKLVDSSKPHFAAEVYKAYLHCTAKMIRSEGGVVTAYDGDRVMGIFIGNSKNTSAVRCGMKINWNVKNMIQPLLKAQYSQSEFILRQTVGIDTSKLLVARTGVRGANDLVWVGRAANYAAKLTELDPEYPTWITLDVFKNMHESVKYGQGKSMWEERTWTAMNNMTIYRSNWWWSIRS
jgi:class 3 adenylate cyclase